MRAEATRTQAIGEADARRPRRRSAWPGPRASTAQRRAIGSEQTALVAALREVGAGHVKIVPDIQVGGDGGGVIGGLGALLMRSLSNGNGHVALPSGGGAGGGDDGYVEEDDFETIEPLEEHVVEAPAEPEPSTYGFTPLPVAETLEPEAPELAESPAATTPTDADTPSTEYYTRAELEQMTVADLRAVAHDAGIDHSGLKKSELVDALLGE